MDGALLICTTLNFPKCTVLTQKAFKRIGVHFRKCIFTLRSNVKFIKYVAITLLILIKQEEHQISLYV
jgi:hypothetical protein